MFKKQIPTVVGVLIVTTLAAAVGFIIFSRNTAGDIVRNELFFIQERDIGKNEQLDQAKEDNWKTFRNEKYGFEISYPENLNLEESDGYGTGFSLEADSDILLSIYAGIDQVGYDGRLNTLTRGDVIEGTTIPLLEEVVIEEGVVDGARESFKASYVRNTYNAINDIMETEDVVELYATDNYAYIMSCKKDIEKCKDIFSTFRLLEL